MMFTHFSPTTDLENLKSTLDTYGVAVLTNVFKEEECEFLKKCVFDYLAVHHDVHEPDDFKKLKPLKTGIFNSYGISLLKEVLDMKTDDRVINAFKKIWNDEEVTTSLDALNIMPPPEKLTNKPPANLIWFHTDQSSNKKEMCCVQAFINLEHTDVGDGCLSVLVNSHKYHKEFFEHFNIDTHDKDWYQINLQDHYEWYMQRKCEWKKVLAPKGSIVFWDSRTIHMGSLPVENRENPNRWRFVIYVCYTPLRLQSEEDAKDKEQAYIENRCTSHWPYSVYVGHKMHDDKKVNKIENLTERHFKYIIGRKKETNYSRYLSIIKNFLRIN